MAITVELATQILDENDAPIKDDVTKKPVTLRDALTKVLLADFDGNGQPVRGDDKVRRYELYLKLKQAREAASVEFTPEEATLLREAAKGFPTLVMGQVRAALA